MCNEPPRAAGEGPVRLTIELIPKSTPIAGSVQLAKDGAMPFSGWIDLVAVVQEAIAGDPEQRSPVPAREESDETSSEQQTR